MCIKKLIFKAEANNLTNMVIQSNKDANLALMNTAIVPIIADEWAIEFKWTDGLKAVVCFHKGDWTVGKFLNNEITDHFILSDGENIDTENVLLKALIKERLKKNLSSFTSAKYADSYGVCRTPFAQTIIDVMAIWVKNFNFLKEVNILQVGRNSYVHQDGKIETELKTF